MKKASKIEEAATFLDKTLRNHFGDKITAVGVVDIKSKVGTKMVHQKDESFLIVYVKNWKVMKPAGKFVDALDAASKNQIHGYNVKYQVMGAVRPC